jgi:hypothetical protein
MQPGKPDWVGGNRIPYPVVGTFDAGKSIKGPPTGLFLVVIPTRDDLLACGVSAVNGNRYAVDQLRCRRGKENGRSRQVPGLRPLAAGNASNDFAVELRVFADSTGKFRLDPARGDRIYADAVFGERDGQ